MAVRIIKAKGQRSIKPYCAYLFRFGGLVHCFVYQLANGLIGSQRCGLGNIFSQLAGGHGSKDIIGTEYRAEEIQSSADTRK